MSSILDDSTHLEFCKAHNELKREFNGKLNVLQATATKELDKVSNQNFSIIRKSLPIKSEIPAVVYGSVGMAVSIYVSQPREGHPGQPGRGQFTGSDKILNG